MGKKGHPNAFDPLLVQAVSGMMDALCMPDTIERSMSKRFHVTHRTIRNYIKYVREHRAETRVELPVSRMENIEDIERSFRQLRARCISVGDHKTAAICTDRIARIHGAFIERHEISGPNGGPLEVDLADARAALLKGIAGIAESDPARGRNSGSSGRGGEGS